MSTVAIAVKEPYLAALEPLGDLQNEIDQALRHHALERINARIAEIQREVKTWEDKYNCSYDVFVYRVATEKGYVEGLNSHPGTQLWEGDMVVWEFYALELKEWYQRLQNILTA